jgi:hypothetical protein
MSARPHDVVLEELDDSLDGQPIFRDRRSKQTDAFVLRLHESFQIPDAP